MTKHFKTQIILATVIVILSLGGFIFFVQQAKSGDAAWQQMDKGATKFVAQGYSINYSKDDPTDDSVFADSSPSSYSVKFHAYIPNSDEYEEYRTNLSYSKYNESQFAQGTEWEGYYLNDNGDYRFGLEMVPNSKKEGVAYIGVAISIVVGLGGLTLVLLWKPKRRAPDLVLTE